MATATVSYKAELSDLRAKLASVTDISRAEANKMVKDLDRSLKAVEKLQDRATAGSKSFAGGLSGAAAASTRLARAGQSVAIQLPDVAAGLASGVPASQIFVQQGLQVLQVNMDLVSKGAGKMGLSMASLGPIALAVAPFVLALGAAYLVLSDDLERAESKAADMARVSGALGDSHVRLERSLASADLELQKALGSYDAVTAAQAKRDTEIRAAATAERQAASLIVETAKAHRNQAETLDESRIAEQELGRAILQRDRIMDGVARRETAALETSAMVVEATEARAHSEEVLRARLKNRSAAEADAARTAREAEAESAKATRAAEAAALKAAKDRENASEQLVSIESASSLSVLSGQRRITEEYLRQIAVIAELEAVSGDQAAADAARSAVTTEAEEQTWKLRRERVSSQMQLNERAASAELRQVQAISEARQQTTAMWLQSTQVTAQALSGMFAEGSAAAAAFFVVSQGLAAGQAIVSGIAASVAALAPPPLGLGPILGAPLAAATQAFGYTQAGVIAATTVASFADTPGIQTAGPGGLTGSFAPGDKVIAGRDNADLVRQMGRAGLGGGGEGSQVLVRDADRNHGRYGRDPMRPPERYTPLRARAGRTPGRR